MFKRNKDKELDFKSLNEILSIGSKLSRIFFAICIIAIILLGTYLIKEWGILSFIKDFIIVISPIFIGFIIAGFTKNVYITLGVSFAIMVAGLFAIKAITKKKA